MKLEYKNTLSMYELQNIKWRDINCDKELLLKFIKRLKLVKFLSFFLKKYREEYIILLDILETQDSERITGMLNNDENICRSAIIEKWSRIASIEILVFGRYTKDTYNIISGLPIDDYRMIEKRTRELVSIVQEIRIQDEKISDSVPGL